MDLAIDPASGIVGVAPPVAAPPISAAAGIATGKTPVGRQAFAILK
jgi:hypothetical protein